MTSTKIPQQETPTDSWNNAQDENALPTIEDARAALEALGDDKEARLDYLRGLVPSLIDVGATERQRWRDLCHSYGLGKMDFRDILKEATTARAEKEKAEAAEARAAANAAARAEAEQKGILLPKPSDPMAVARLLVARWPATDSVSHVAWWRGDFYEFTGTHWSVVEDSMIHQKLYAATEHAVWLHPAYGMQEWAPTRRSLGDLSHALGQGIVQRNPALSDERCIACTNGVLDLAGNRLLPHHPLRFNLSALPFAYDSSVACPQWETFLMSVFPDDEGARLFLQEWFGYLVSGRTDLQKMLNLFGPRRSGKGTIARVMEAMLGPESVASPTLQSLAGSFGEQQLIGKSLAVLSDISWNARDAAEAVEVLKAISGEDSREINRKNREFWHGKLGVRFVLISNDMPKFKDSSGALTGRMIHIQTKTSFFNREDPGLTSRLLGELPGILNWALMGLTRLSERGRLLVPESSDAAESEINRQTSPVAGFLEDRATISTPDNPFNTALRLDDVYEAYQHWCKTEDSRDHVTTKDVFSRDLRSAGNGAIQIERKRADGGKRIRLVYGLGEAFPGSLSSPSGAGAGNWLIGD